MNVKSGMAIGQVVLFGNTVHHGLFASKASVMSILDAELIKMAILYIYFQNSLINIKSDLF